MAKKLSVAEILAAARAEKSGGAAPKPTESAPAAPAEPTPAAEVLPKAEIAEPAPPPEPAAPAGKAASADKASTGKAAPGGKGMSMADILAAARAGKGGGGPAPKPVAEKPAKPAVAEKPAKAAVAEKPAAKPAPAKKTDGNGATAAPKDTASILAAARKGAKPGPMSKSEAAALARPPEPAAKRKLDVPPLPAKPDYARPRPAPEADAATRRSFLAMASAALFGSSMAIGFTSLAATHLMWLLGLARFMFPNILIEPPTRFKVGFPDALAPGQVETKFIAQFGVWVVKYEFEGQPMVYALKSVCTHLGCTPNWLEAEQKFKCPCHGSGFYKDGVNFEGPAPRPLERYAISLADDGQLLVDKSRTFQEEMGQWKDPASFVPV
jgi:cytochrome b6-f complex iron-sulfur subunit